MKFDFSKSNESDLQNKLQMNKLDIMSGNILYLTHEMDKVKKIVTQMQNSINLQKQVDDYFETSPQTDTDELPDDK